VSAVVCRLSAEPFSNSLLLQTMDGRQPSDGPSKTLCDTSHVSTCSMPHVQRCHSQCSLATLRIGHASQHDHASWCRGTMLRLGGTAFSARLQRLGRQFRDVLNGSLPELKWCCSRLAAALPSADALDVQQTIQAPVYHCVQPGLQGWCMSGLVCSAEASAACYPDRPQLDALLSLLALHDGEDSGCVCTALTQQ
jgi:hypothetical protein